LGQPNGDERMLVTRKDGREGRTTMGQETDCRGLSDVSV